MSEQDELARNNQRTIVDFKADSKQDKSLAQEKDIEERTQQ